MTPEVQDSIDNARKQMEKAIGHLENELAKIRAGRANPSMLDQISVSYYGSSTPLNQIANVSTPDPKTLTIQPWDKTAIEAIEKAIQEANIGLNPQNDGDIIRINIPALTEERRQDLVKKTKAEAEQARVSVRNIRRDANDAIRKLVKQGLAEDAAKNAEGKVQQLTDEYTKKVESHLQRKEKEITTV